MKNGPIRCFVAVVALTTIVVPRAGLAGPAASLLTVETMLQQSGPDAPVNNSAFKPGLDATPAPEFSGVLSIAQSQLQTTPVLVHPVLEGRDARMFPALNLEFFTIGAVLVPVQRGEMVREEGRVQSPSYWCAIPQFGRVWHERADGDWSRAAFPLMLVNAPRTRHIRASRRFCTEPARSAVCVSSSCNRPHRICSSSTLSCGARHGSTSPAAMGSSLKGVAVKPRLSFPVACRPSRGANF